MVNNRNYLLWNMTKKCNFRCKYCYFPHDSSPIKSGLPVEKILGFLDSTRAAWTIGMTGGEPFIYPDFVELCGRLTEKHRIDMDSNLSITSRVTRFAHAIDPTRVNDIYAALHIEERERMDGVEQFIRNVLLLKNMNFHVSVNYVIHPTLAHRFEIDSEYFKSRGIRLLPRPFKGIYNDKDYPLSYTKDEKALFSSKPKAGGKLVYNFKGIPCNAGKSLIRLEPDGTVFRCPGDRTILGDITDSVNLYTEPKPCNVSRCPCFGSDYVLLDRAQEHFMTGLREFMIGRRNEATESFQKSIELNPDASNAHCNLGVIYWQKRDLTKAFSCFQTALAAHPFNKIYIMNTAALLVDMGDPKAAVATCTSFLERYQDREIESLSVGITGGNPGEYAGKVCVDIIPGNTRTDIFTI